MKASAVNRVEGFPESVDYADFGGGLSEPNHMSPEEHLRRLRQFIPILVHELRTPLTPLLGASEMLSSGIKEEPWANLARSIQLSAEKMVRMVDELADLGRCECGTLILEISDVDLSRMLGEVVESRRAHAVTLGLKLVMELPESLPLVRGDAARLRQVALTLLETAFRQVPEGGCIRVGGQSADQSVMITVTGENINLQDHGNFCRQSRIDNMDNYMKKPVTPGLLLAGDLILLHKGRAGVVVQAGESHTYWFSVPVNSLRGGRQ